ncbi:orotidine-5'-phosphate decarboxylase [Savagea sp. SN6]|uniref:Orotidine 5'-phosphate decarboxylase n=1 Tax=Savagea serpentis TaxID=2785297 RepID=A0A8J7KDD1_9BACL|nr:orotidine-5'-phosphate decarboxylase [Savagea serpentis]MBF4499886.1 orotidine-5'-phosphate decarboxylase [Savagea serpentis]
MTDSPFIALDFPTGEEALRFLQPFEGKANVKVGMELFYKEGPAILRELKARGYGIFLDLKLHDIPNTVKSAMKILAQYEVELVNVHAAGGVRMMEAALEGLEEGTPAGKTRPRIIAVTQLTSTDEASMRADQLIEQSLEQSVVHYAKKAQEAGLDGVVCSVLEAKMIEEACGKDFLKVTPGIRMASGETHDQKRVATPQFARENGSTHIVVGRAITQAADAVKAHAEVNALWKGQ